ncbi:Laccase-2 [Ooceraea biroi]|uniref:Laccase-2 n=1 Tax=Ooceraea biroi TaxID=2015173 RepID=A0A026VUB4_OOCBI|nr:Laccase-2 [Ooceraea biroi]
MLLIYYYKQLVFFQVCRGDYLIIDVQNDAEGLEASIHWHGVFQNGYQYYDGVPYLTQCPILSADTFR